MTKNTYTIIEKEKNDNATMSVVYSILGSHILRRPLAIPVY